MLTARVRLPFFSIPPQVATPSSTQTAPELIASTIDLRAYGLVNAGGSIYIHANPPVPPNNVGHPPTLVSRRIPHPPHPGSAFIKASRALPALTNKPLISVQSPFIPPAGSFTYDIGGVFALPDYWFRSPLVARDNPPPPYAGKAFTIHAQPDSLLPTQRPVLSVSTPPPPPYPGAVFMDIGGVVSSPPPAPCPTLATTPPPQPYPGSAVFRIGSGDLNPTHPGRLIASSTSPLPATLCGSSFITVQKTNTLIQTAPHVIALQSYVPLHPGSTFSRHAPIDNGQHRLAPLIAIESARPYPAGSVYYESGPPDNGIRYQNPLTVSMLSSDVMVLLSGRNLAGGSLGVAGSPMPPVPPQPPVPPSGSAVEICPFTVDFQTLDAFTIDFSC